MESRALFVDPNLLTVDRECVVNRQLRPEGSICGQRRRPEWYPRPDSMWEVG